MKDLWLIRHAESFANVGAATSTPREVPLSENGLRQAATLPTMLTARPDLIILSPYRRSAETAQPFIDLFPGVRTETWNIQEFTYLSISRCRGTSHQQRKPWVAEYWDRCDPAYCDGDQSESFAEFIGRCRELVRLAGEVDFSLAFAFTHEQFMKGLLWDAAYSGREPDAAAMESFKRFADSFAIPNASVLRTVIDADGSIYFGAVNAVLQSKRYA